MPQVMVEQLPDALMYPSQSRSESALQQTPTLVVHDTGIVAALKLHHRQLVIRALRTIYAHDHARAQHVGITGAYEPCDVVRRSQTWHVAAQYTVYFPQLVPQEFFEQFFLVVNSCRGIRFIGS